MTHRHGTKNCRDCGQPFGKSAGDYTVRCPDCRAKAQGKAPAKPDSGECIVCAGAGGWTERRAIEGRVYVSCWRCGGSGARS